MLHAYDQEHRNFHVYYFFLCFKLKIAALFTNTHKIRTKVALGNLLEITGTRHNGYVEPSPFPGDEQDRHERNEYRDEAIKQVIHVRVSDKRGQRNND